MKYKTVFSNETDIFNNNTGIAIKKTIPYTLLD